MAPRTTVDVAAALGEQLSEGEPDTDREFFIDNLLVRIHFSIVMIRWTGLAPREDRDKAASRRVAAALGAPLSEREPDTERLREGERDTDRLREGETDTDRSREGETDTDRLREGETDADTVTVTEGERDRDSDRGRERARES